VSFDGGSSLTVLRLCCSFNLQPEYSGFRSRLEQFLPLLNRSTLPITDDEAIDTVLEVLQAEVEKHKDRDEDTVDEAGQPQAPMDNVDNALKILVHNATEEFEEFGFIPRDVYDGVIKLHQTRDRHAVALRDLNYTELPRFVQTFWMSRGPEFPEGVVVVFPRPSTYLGSFDHWAIDFKSIRIARKMVESLLLQEEEHLRELYEDFYRDTDGFNLARWVFEAIVHRMFSDGLKSGPTPRTVPMVPNGCDPLIFSTDPSSSTPDTSLSSFWQPRTGTRTVTRVDFTDRQLDGVTLDNDKYYIPTVDTHPFFDSFTIDMDPRAVVISVFRITISPRNEGPAEGYLQIHKIMRRVRELLEEADCNATVKVTYVLVCPDDGCQYQWRMPVGWNEDTETDDHRGGGSCILVPLPESSRYVFPAKLNHGWM